MKSISLLIKAGPYDPPLHPDLAKRVVGLARRLHRKRKRSPHDAAKLAIDNECRVSRVYLSGGQVEKLIVAVADVLVHEPVVVTPQRVRTKKQAVA